MNRHITVNSPPASLPKLADLFHDMSRKLQDMDGISQVNISIAGIEFDVQESEDTKLQGLIRLNKIRNFTATLKGPRNHDVRPTLEKIRILIQNTIQEVCHG